MKTHIIPIENHDDYISINDKIIWAKSPARFVSLARQWAGENIIVRLDFNDSQSRKCGFANCGSL